MLQEMLSFNHLADADDRPSAIPSNSLSYQHPKCTMSRIKDHVFLAYEMSRRSKDNSLASP